MSLVRTALVVLLAGCGSTPSPPTTQPVAPAPPDAGIDAPGPDAAPAVPDSVTNAPAWRFGYRTADRTETWTLQHAEGRALLVVVNAQGEQRYIGSAVETGGELVLDVTTGTAKLALKCKLEKLAVGAKCSDRKAKPIEVLSCYHVDFKTPMPFGPAPGVDYVVDASCNGYRLATP